jgi:esterase/lipase superfamily enzyme
MYDYVLCTRNIDDFGEFGDELDVSRYLMVPEGDPWTPSAQEPDRQAWAKSIISYASTTGEDILIFVHGYNNTQAEVKERHDDLKTGLRNLGFNGVVVSFDWPSGDSALAYLKDRSVANRTANLLVSDGIYLLSQFQRPDCRMNVHLLGHSTGAYVIREAFDHADDATLPNNSWLVSQIALISGDVSANSMSAGDSGSKSLYGHCVRLTNYSNSHDKVLDISEVKRLGVGRRLGRVGLPDDAPEQAVNVDCSDYFASLKNDDLVYTHSWQFDNELFIQDLFYTINGVDRGSMPTRSDLQPPKPHRFILVKP